ncbi:protein phosphatase 1 regulatory subunit 11 [Plakobranchus ocellatus]|uniref:E3 ubiquitin-protein ligase PPP1R11 n=1 Tax=Plakobranchus ocellatus TaxID=259542 RepID=A0AAV4DYS6_9GAST|nr:protein phosphatase 1 regulatory subunit 11 [Plakobranchus ocellatus]
MAESRSNLNEMNGQASTAQISQIQTETIVENAQEHEGPPVLTLRLQQPGRPEQKVKWSSDTVDNEFMGKKKSKCCCIYEKPKVFGESDSSSEDEDGDDSCTPHCRGHKKKCYRHGKKGHDHDHDNHGHDNQGNPDSDDMAGVI